MSEPKQRFRASLAKGAVYETGLRSFMEYGDLGVERATQGKFRVPDIYSLAVHPTVVVDRLPEVAAAAH